MPPSVPQQAPPPPHRRKMFLKWKCCGGCTPPCWWRGVNLNRGSDRRIWWEWPRVLSIAARPKRKAEALAAQQHRHTQQHRLSKTQCLAKLLCQIAKGGKGGGCKRGGKGGGWARGASCLSISCTRSYSTKPFRKEQDCCCSFLSAACWLKRMSHKCMQEAVAIVGVTEGEAREFRG